MEQIQQHKWSKYTYVGRWESKCIHCLITRFKPFSGSKPLYTIGRFTQRTEPACITRTINAPQREADK